MNIQNKKLQNTSPRNIHNVNTSNLRCSIPRRRQQSNKQEVVLDLIQSSSSEDGCRSHSRNLTLDQMLFFNTSTSSREMALRKIKQSPQSSRHLPMVQKIVDCDTVDSSIATTRRRYERRFGKVGVMMFNSRAA